MKKFISSLTIIVLLIFNFSNVTDISHAEPTKNFSESPGIEIEDELLDFFISEEFQDSIADDYLLSKEILDNNNVIDIVSKDPNLVEEFLSNESVVDTLAAETDLIDEIVNKENVVNTIVNDSDLAKIVFSDDKEINNNLIKNKPSIITEDITVVKEILNDEEITSTVADDVILANNIIENNNIVNTIAKTPDLVTEVLTNDNIIQYILEDDKLIDKISSNQNTINAFLDEEDLVNSLLSEPNIVEEIKTDLISDYNNLLEKTLENKANNINPIIKNLDSDGIEIQLDIDSDEYNAELIFDSTLDGNNITFSSKFDLENNIKTTIYDVKITKNTDEEFKILLKNKQTGEIISISEDDAHASIAGIIVRVVSGAIKFFSKQTGKQVTKSAAKNAKKAFSGGKAGEKYLETLVKVKGTQVYKRTSLGGRYIDVLDTSGIAHESKVGYVTLTKRIRTQIDKDSLLIKSKSEKDIKGAKWHFFRSSKNGKIGPSKSVKNYLKLKGISYKIHDK